MDSIFASQSRGYRFDTQLVHMPVLLMTNAHPDIIKANHPWGILSSASSRRAIVSLMESKYAYYAGNVPSGTLPRNSLTRIIASG